MDRLRAHCALRKMHERIQIPVNAKAMKNQTPTTSRIVKNNSAIGHLPNVSPSSPGAGPYDSALVDTVAQNLSSAGTPCMEVAIVTAGLRLAKRDARCLSVGGFMAFI